MMKVLVFGGTGAMGTSLVSILAELGEDVPEFEELWDEELTEEECLVLIDRFTKKMEEE